MLTPYLKKIFEIAVRGDATEESYYSTLEGLLNEFAGTSGMKNIRVTTLPKKTEAGNPDFRVWDGKQHIVGYIEAKALSLTNLDDIENSSQLKRYRETFPNLILTNFFEFRLYRNGCLLDKVSVARPFIVHRLKTIPPVEREEEFKNLLDKFLSFSLPKVYDARTLAVALARRTRFLKEEIISEELIEEEREGRGFILGFFKAFREFLIGGLTREDFADLYSQTIAYGLFAARTRTENAFNRKLAYDSIPPTIGILRDVFSFISLGELPKQMEWIIDDISGVLAVTDVNKILQDYFHEGKGKDPIVHFYETFLSEYDPLTRERRGVYYTPEPVVTYIVRSIHAVLKTKFGRPDGLASPSVTVLDPAAGTLTFLAEAAKIAVEEFVAKYGEGGKEKFIKEHILQNFYAFELMMAPYAVGHLKISFLLKELDCRLNKEDRFKLYLTNTLEMEELAQTELPGMASLSEESHLAGKVKKETPILVILGNPPYSGHSANKGKWIDDSLKKGFVLPDGTRDDGYYKIDGKPLGEKNPKWLQDDYVKFIRFAQWKISQEGEGILGFISNHSYLDNPTFRGMRQSLTKSFNEIRILDLHGNSLKKEKCPDGSKDENVFDIQQGVAIGLFLKKKGDKQKTRVLHSEVWGLRDRKYEWLSARDIQKTKWQALSPKSEFYLFIPRDEELLAKYEKYPKITDIFSLNSVGIVTARDNLTIKWSPEEVWQTVLNFSKMDKELARQAYNLGKDARDWKVELAQKDLMDSGPNREKILPILYRPFDVRFTYYTGKSRGFICMPRPAVMRHMMQDNLGLITHKREELDIEWSHAIITNAISEHGLLSSKTTSYHFPLYLYKENPENPLKKRKSHENLTLIFDPEAKYEIKNRKPNIEPEIFDKLIFVYKNKLTPEDILYYIYSIFYSNIYRRKYVEFLKIDFPRIPFTADENLFKKIAVLGKKLVDLHLLKSQELDPPLAKFQGKGDHKVDKVRYTDDRVYINTGQYFEGIPSEVWEFKIGGYQVCDKWLKDRKGRSLSLVEIKHYCHISTSIGKTIKIQFEIDRIFPKIEKKTLEF